MKIFRIPIFLTLCATLLVTSACDRIERNRAAFNSGHEAKASTTASSPVTSTSHNSTAHASSPVEKAEIPVNPAGLPSQIKEYEGYTVSFNRQTGNPNWSAWELTAAETDGVSSRSKEKFWQDPDIAGCMTTKDYTNSGFDRGHLCPAADMKWSAQAMTDCFSMANITPQNHSLNSGAWSTLEKKCRLWAQRDGSLLIAAGPIYENATETIANGKIKVPTAFFKVIAAPYIDSPRGIAFVYPNQSAPGNMNVYAMSIDEVEKMTGYDFFANLPDDVENAIESTYSFREWDKR